ncbi:hypothetical protein TGAMA5MH_02414 [Trichoderma gamsii]|uniref:Uncharacterized protein n=1 Tax=Trichoderma gamsii TaxID=398673 RepID=A0A2K0TLI8_9HYPO|nr:hypothetical protein TGAMA5MH_02414 [Trichoderma gamsii]
MQAAEEVALGNVLAGIPCWELPESRAIRTPLLPDPPFLFHPRSFSAAYGVPLPAVLKCLSSKSDNNGGTWNHVLVIAIAYPILTRPSPRFQSADWKAAQSLLARTNNIISFTCNEVSIKRPGEPSSTSAGLDPCIIIGSVIRVRKHENAEPRYHLSASVGAIFKKKAFVQ